MDSRIILTMADFSANNIGRYVELSDLTKKVLAKQTQYEYQSDEAAALNEFLENLTNDGFIGGQNPLLKTLIIPALAKQHSELLYNIANLDSNGYPINEMSELESEAESEQFLLERDANNRVVALYRKYVQSEGETVRDQISIDTHLFPELNIEVPTFFMGVYGYGNDFNSTTNSNILTNNALNYNIQFASKKIRLYYEQISHVSNTIVESGHNKGFYGLNYVKDTGFSGYAGETGSLESAVIAGDLSNIKTQTNSGIFSIGSWLSDRDRNFNFSAIMFGDFIESSKLALLKGYFDTLMTALHVNVNEQ